MKSFSRMGYTCPVLSVLVPGNVLLGPESCGLRRAAVRGFGTPDFSRGPSARSRDSGSSRAELPTNR